MRRSANWPCRQPGCGDASSITACCQRAPAVCACAMAGSLHGHVDCSRHVNTFPYCSRSSGSSRHLISLLICRSWAWLDQGNSASCSLVMSSCLRAQGLATHPGKLGLLPTYCPAVVALFASRHITPSPGTADLQLKATHTDSFFTTVK
jgi:hypothetical protein